MQYVHIVYSKDKDEIVWHGAYTNRFSAIIKNNNLNKYKRKSAIVSLPLEEDN